MTCRTTGIPCLVPALRNEHFPNDFKGPRKVPNYTADLPPEAWIESYEMAMKLLEVSDVACAKYFTMMLDGTARAWLKGLPANSIGSWAELKAQFIQNFKDMCKQPMSDCGFGCLRPRRGRVNNPLCAPGQGYPALIG